MIKGELVMQKIDQMNASEWIAQEERSIAAKLFGVRIKLGIKRKELADVVGIVTEAELEAYETGVEEVPASTLFVLASAMGLSPGYFFGEDDSKFCGTNVSVGEPEKITALLS
jgi:hypothetical protein